MVSNNAQLKQISVALRENRLYKERTSWNQSNAVYKEAKVRNLYFTGVNLFCMTCERTVY